MSRRVLFLLALLSLPFLMAHGGGGCGGDEESVFGPPTQSACPNGSTITYANFGQAFMTQYCTRCHSSELVGAARNGAPKFHDFDTVGGIRSVSDHVDQTAASGPASTNTSMPPSGPIPTEDERKKLGEWLQCGAP
ncbi:MAG: c-type cytochrome [Myxococcales bacterium]|nr:c-type cytochrome [Myxococcales bacterium]